MAEMEEDDVLRVDGYVFKTKEAAERAARELTGSRFIRQKIEFADPDKILQIYNKIIEENMFETPVGYQFLRDVRNHLLAVSYIDKTKVKDIPVKETAAASDSSKEGKRAQAREETEKKRIKKELKTLKSRFRLTVIAILVLVAVVIAMFVILQSSDNITILNYKEKIVNQYEQWEQDLKAREQAVQDYESKYGIVPNTNTDTDSNSNSNADLNNPVQ